jgi:bacteriocin biosynthesis cyclodehydratase domain-containing protein
VPGDAARRLQAATVIIVGLGGVGRTVARLLAMAGVGRLVLLDPNSVRSSDVSLGCNAVHVGRPIVNALAAELAAHRAELVPMIGSVDEVPDWDRVVADASLIILANDDMSLAGYDRVNQACLEHETPWVSARIDRSRGIIGPFVVPKQTACFTCFELRSRVNAEFPQDHEALHRHWKGCGESPDTWPMIAPFVEMVGACVALDAQRVLGAKALSAFLGRILHWDLHGFESRFHELLKLPRCPACSRARERPLEKIWDLRPAARG